ncbi:MAG: hypothetical protein ABSG31_04495 [Tepidisphaeraceae bacterium]|jgi:hypothetical protein
MLFQFVQVIYWLALASWFGGALFIAGAAREVFRTLRDENPVLPHVLSVNLEGKHSILLGGSVVANIVAMLWRWGTLCAALLVGTVTAQWFILDTTRNSERASLLIRSFLLLGAIVVSTYDRFSIWPKAWKYRKEFVENADEPDKANPALDRFERYQRESFLLLNVVVFLLLGMVLFSGGISPPAVAL